MRKVRIRIGALIRAIVVLGICYIILMPLFTKLSSAFMTERDLYDQTVKWIPRNPTLDNFKLVWRYMKYPEAFKNSFLLALSVSLLQLAACTVVGYGFARFQFRGRNLLFGLVVFTLIVPPNLIMIPMYLNFRYFDLFGLLPDGGINLLGSYWPFILMAATGTGMRNGIFIYIMRQFFRGMPRDLEEAAYVDGAGPFTTFFRIMLPGAVPAMVIVFLFGFVWQWNDYFLTNIFMGGQTLLPLTLDSLVFSASGLVTGGMMLTGQYASLINNTGMLLFMAPLLVLYAFLQRYFVESVERTGLVG